MFFLESFFGRIATDFRQKELLPLKLLFFVHSSTLYVLYPYLTIHMRELGINVEETAVMSAITPVVAIIMPPIAGLIADRIGNFKVILSLLSTLGGLAALLLLLVPTGRVVVTLPSSTPLQLSCHQGRLEMMMQEGSFCSQYSNRTRVVDLQVEACGMTCSIPQHHSHPYAEIGKEFGRVDDILHTKEFRVDLRQGNITEVYDYRLNGSSLATQVSSIANDTLFFPMAGLYTYECLVQTDNSSQCHIQKTETGTEVVAKRTKLASIISGEEGDKYVINQLKQQSPGHLSKYRPLTCYHKEEELSLESHVVTVSSKGQNIELKGCLVNCLASVQRKDICTNKDMTKELDISLTFWLYLSIRVFIGMISGTSFAMFEGAVIAILREHKADYGLQRIYATIGGMISSPLSGWLIDYASERAGYTDFRPAFYMYAALKVVSAVLMLRINLEFKAPATDVVADVLVVLRKIEIVALLATCFILGTAWGYIESFLFWLLQDLGASRSLMGITITVGGIAGLPLLVMSGPIIDKIGHANVLFIGFIFYAIRLMGYSLIYNAWMCLIFEAMESVTSSLAFTAAVTYAAKLSTMTTDSSIQGLIGGLYYGVGKGAGSLIGGYLMHFVGTRPTYQIFAGMTLITGIVYFLFNKFYIVKKVEKLSKKEAEANRVKLEIEKQKPIENENEKAPIAVNNLNSYKTNEVNSEGKALNSCKAIDVSEEKKMNCKAKETDSEDKKVNSCKTNEVNSEENGGSQINRGFEPDPLELKPL